MCTSTPTVPEAPEIDYDAAAEATALPAADPLPTPQQTPPPAPVAPLPPPTPVVTPPPPVQADPAPVAPPPELVAGSEDAPVVKKRKSKRAINQQKAKGTSALKIPLNTAATAGAGGSSGGLNIPTSR